VEIVTSALPFNPKLKQKLKNDRFVPHRRLFSTPRGKTGTNLKRKASFTPITPEHCADQSPQTTPGASFIPSRDRLHLYIRRLFAITGARPSEAPMTRIIDHFSEIAPRYRAAFVDLWGCLHNGYQPFAPAVAALERFKAQGGIVVLLTNSPRPKPAVIRQLDKIGVPRDVYDEVAASGDASQYALAAGDVGSRIYHLGPERDLGFFEGLPEDVLQGRVIERVALDQAEGIVCTGLFDDDTETPEDYRATLLYAKTKGLKLLCTNPDLIVDKGDTRIYCAGAIAKAYEEIGGTSLYFGKPHPPAYDLARNRLAALGDVTDEEIICIGDGINTDIRGAIAEDLDSLFITGGLARHDTGTAEQPDPAKLKAFLDAAQMSPQYAMGALR
jgi:HAD superfamily hydrolase (TIGR01459 family)